LKTAELFKKKENKTEDPELKQRIKVVMEQDVKIKQLFGVVSNFLNNANMMLT
jgi:hypothetical protein